MTKRTGARRSLFQTESLPNGVVTEYSYDAASRLKGLTYTKGGATLGNLTYAYDGDGKRTTVGGSYARKGLPQAASTTSYNAANQQTAFGSETLTYDSNGNLTSDGLNSALQEALLVALKVSRPLSSQTPIPVRRQWLSFGLSKD